MYNIWFKFYGVEGQQKVECDCLESAQITWDILNGDDRVIMMSVRP